MGSTKPLKRVLYLSYDGMTDPLGQSQVLPYLTGLCRQGYAFTLISFEKEGVYEKGRVRVQEICDEAGIKWVPLPYTKKPPIISTLKDVWNMRATALKMHQEAPFDLVHCRSYISALAGEWLKKKTGVPFLFDMRGFWADERVDGGLWNLGNPLFKTVFNFFKRKEKDFLTGADGIISLTWAGREEIEKWGLQTVPVQVIPCCVDTTLFDPAHTNAAGVAALKAKLDIPSQNTVVGYVGSLGTWYQLPEMLAFFATWLQKQPDSTLLFVTLEPEAMILAAAQSAGIPATQIRVTGASRKEMPHYIALMDWGLFFIKPAYSKKASSPVKQGEMMAMGLPVICNSGVGDSDRIITQYEAGVLVKGYTTKDFEESIAQAEQQQFDSQKIRSGALDYFSLDKGIEDYATAYKSILG